jgi:cytochrome c peroxidase
MISGVRGSAEAAVRAGIRGIQFAVRPDEDAAAIDEYLKSLKPVPSPHLIDGALSEKAKRGEVAFQKAGCANCHPAPLFTNLKAFNVGTGKGREVNTEFDNDSRHVDDFQRRGQARKDLWADAGGNRGPGRVHTFVMIWIHHEGTKRIL